MVAPKFISEEAVSLADVKKMVNTITERDEELNYRTTKTKEFLESFDIIDVEKKEALMEKLKSLDLTRLKEDHMAKIIDFMPQTAEDLKAVLGAYPLSLPKKDQDAILGALKE